MADLDIDRHDDLVTYLRGRGVLAEGEHATAESLKGGVSCRTVRVSLAGGASWVVKQALPKLRVEAEWLSDPRRIRREALVMEMLAGLIPDGALPRLIFEDADEDLVVMEAVDQPHSVWKELLLAGDLRDAHVEQFGSLLAAIHRESHAAAEVFAPAFDDREFFETLRLDPYYRYSALQRPEAAPFLDLLIDDTLAERIALTHGDYSPKNVLVREGRLVLLDHEVAHWGDGAFDIGFGMTHLLAKARHVRGAGDRFIEAAHLFWSAYGDAAGPPFDGPDYEERAVRHTIGCLLARAVGKSPLEYLGASDRASQADDAVWLMQTRPGSMPELIEQWSVASGRAVTS